MAEYQVDVPIVTQSQINQIISKQDLFYTQYFQDNSGLPISKNAGLVDVSNDLSLSTLFIPQFRTVSIGVFNYSGAGTLVVQTGLVNDNGYSLAVTKLNDATLPVTASITAAGLYQVPICGEYIRVFATGTAKATVTIECF